MRSDLQLKLIDIEGDKARAVGMSTTPDRMRLFMAGFPVGVAVLTAFDLSGIPKGMTCSSLCSVTLDPPTLLVSVRQGSPTLRAISDTSGFVLNLLHASAQPTAELFSSGVPDRFDRVHWRREVHFEGPVLAECAHSVASCLVSEVHEVGDHAVVYGAVTSVRQLSRRLPLIYGMRRYGAWPMTLERLSERGK